MDGAPVERVGGLESLFRPASPRSRALLDSAIDPATNQSEQSRERRSGNREISGMFRDCPNPPARLDLDPGLAFHPSHLEPPFQPGLTDRHPGSGSKPGDFEPPAQRPTLYYFP